MRVLMSVVMVSLLLGCGVPAAVSVKGKATNLLKARLTPIEFMVAVTKFECLRGEDDSDPGVIFDAEGDTFEAELVDLTEEGIEIYNGIIPDQYLGEYTHCRATLVAAGQEITYFDTSGTAATQTYVELFEEVDNSGGEIDMVPAAVMQRGDVLVEQSGSFEWFEIDDTKTFAPSDSRDGVTPYQDPSPGDAVQLVELTEPVTIEAAGTYVLTIDFDVTDTFDFRDDDLDGQFEPLSDDHDGTMNGFEFTIKVPATTISATSE